MPTERHALTHPATSAAHPVDVSTRSAVDAFAVSLFPDVPSPRAELLDLPAVVGDIIPILEMRERAAVVIADKGGHRPKPMNRDTVEQLVGFGDLRCLFADRLYEGGRVESFLVAHW